MKRSLWMINGAFVLFLLGVIALFLVTRPLVPPRVSLSVSPIQVDAVSEPITPKIDLALIYEKDPFGTISISTEEKTKVIAKIQTVPPPPMQPPVKNPVRSEPQFLPPLSILLKGIIFSENDRDNRAIIADKKTKTEALYRIGDSILDAQIIKIESNKIILMRSNGQQETIFTSSLDAHNDAMYQQMDPIKNSSLSQAIRVQGERVFAIDPELLVQTIMNLAQFIELLDITTVYEKGRGIGCRIGKVQPHSLGALLGLETYDTITSVNDISTGTASNRVAIYEHIRRLKLEDTIVVNILRTNQHIQITYVLNSFSQHKRVIPIAPAQQRLMPGNMPLQQAAPSESALSRNVPRYVPPLPSPVMPISHQGSLQKPDRSAILENGGRSGMLRTRQP